MTEPFGRLRRFLRELKRRNVYKVAVAYLAVAFVGLQAVDLLIPATTLPSWADAFLLAILIVGFPVAVVVAWAFEMTPEGMRRTETPEGEGSVGAAYQWIALALVVVLAGGVWYARAGGEEQATTEATATRDTAARTASATRDTAGPPRIAVLPFENIAPDTTEDYFAEGMHEEVLNQLSKVSGLEVISRTSVMGYANTEKRVPKISEELGGVNALLEGTVRRAGDQVRITTQLIEAPEDEHLWSNTYERALSVEEIFKIQADIAEQIAGALATQLTSSERQRIESSPTDDMAAYEVYLRGRGQVLQFLGQLTPELLDRATENLREAVRRDSSFAEAYAWLAQAQHARAANRRPTKALPWVDSARITMERARRIDPDVAAVHLAQAGIYAVQDSLKAEAQALRQALKLQPSHALAKARLADNLRRRGQHTQAVRMAREAVRLDPRQPQALEMMGHQLLVVGLYSRAEAWYRHILNIEPGYWTAYENLAFTELNRGRPDRALQMWREYFRQTDSRPSLALFFATNTALAADRPDQARKYLQQIYPEAYAKTPPDFSIGRASQPSSETSVIPPGSGVLAGFIERQIGNEKLGRRVLKEAVDGLRESLERDESLRRPYRTWLAGGLAVLGRTEEAIREVERVAEEPTGAGWLRWYPLLDTLRTEPRFQDVIRRLDARRQKAREGVLQLGIDLYPPGTKSDSGVSRAPNS